VTNVVVGWQYGYQEKDGSIPFSALSSTDKIPLFSGFSIPAELDGSKHYEALIFSADANPATDEPLASYSMDSVLGDANPSSDAALYASAKADALYYTKAMLNVGKVEAALSAAGVTGTVNVRVAVRVKSADPNRADGFIKTGAAGAESSLSAAFSVTATAASGNLRGLLGKVVFNSAAKTRSAVEVLGDRIDGVSLLRHPAVAACRVDVNRTTGERDGHMMITPNGDRTGATLQLYDRDGNAVGTPKTTSSPGNWTLSEAEMHELIRTLNPYYTGMGPGTEVYYTFWSQLFAVPDSGFTDGVRVRANASW
jgi:hypothetical protein